ncbi:hypothetical protein Taro_056267, partial [Colocasia esculenta]|nr:hypothetical protein [Colocasia esculenta]
GATWRVPIHPTASPAVIPGRHLAFPFPGFHCHRPPPEVHSSGRGETPAEPMALLSLQILPVTPPSSSSAAAAASIAAAFPAPPSHLPACSNYYPRRSPRRRLPTVPGEKAACAPLLARASPSSAGYVSPGAEVIGDLPIYSALTGEPVLFRDLWDQNEGTAVVALLRHFGCVCCWELASDLRDAKSIFDAAGVKLIAVGVGTPDKARILAERLPFPLDCLYADPDRKAYDALGLYYGLGRTFFNRASAKVFSRIESLQKAMKNYTISATPDDRSSVLQ